MMKHPEQLMLVAMLGLALALAACAPAGEGLAPGKADGPIAVEMDEFSFDPATVTVQQGQRVTLTLRNVGAVQHDWAVPELNIQSPDVPAGQTARFEFTADQAGQFRIVCTEPGHEEGGMVGELIVQ